MYVNILFIPYFILCDRIKCQGVISVARILDHLAGLNTSVYVPTEDSEIAEQTFDSINDLPTERAKDAANWIGKFIYVFSRNIYSLWNFK